MKHFTIARWGGVALVLFLGVAVATGAYGEPWIGGGPAQPAAKIAAGKILSGGQNAFAAFAMDRAASGTEDADLLKLQLQGEQLKDLTGYSFVFHYDPAKYELVSAKEPAGFVLAGGEEAGATLTAVTKVPGQVHIDASRKDGQAVTGDGKLVELVLRAKDVSTPMPGDFRVANGILVDVNGGTDPMTRVAIGDLSARPATYGLLQNRPNPFNPWTTIGYQMAEPGHVRLIVYNLLGQEVRRLVDEQMEAGYYHIRWDGRDAVGRQLASGVYLYRMTAGEFSKVQRMVLLK